MSKKDDKTPEELSQEDFATVLEELEKFDTSAFSYLAKSENYEIIPTCLEDGTVLGAKEINMLKREVDKLGAVPLYRIDLPNGETLLISVNSDTLKTMVLKEGLQ